VAANDPENTQSEVRVWPESDGSRMSDSGLVDPTHPDDVVRVPELVDVGGLDVERMGKGVRGRRSVEHGRRKKAEGGWGEGEGILLLEPVA
jgi:hypothetical protein